MKAAHPMPFPATRQPSATEPPYLRTIRPSAASRPERDTGRKRSRIMLSRQQRDATHGRTACIAANPAVPQTQPQTCGHVSAVPTCHPVRPATGYGTDKDSIGGGVGPPRRGYSGGGRRTPPKRIKTVSAVISHRRYCLSAAGRRHAPHPCRLLAGRRGYVEITVH